MIGCQTVADAKDAYSEGVIISSRGRVPTPLPPNGKKNMSTQVGDHHSSSLVQCAIDDLPHNNVPLKEVIISNFILTN